MSIQTSEQAELERLKSDIADALRTIAQLSEENAALRRDAERYRWLRNIAEFDDWEFISSQTSDNKDATIDAAMREQAISEVIRLPENARVPRIDPRMK